MSSDMTGWSETPDLLPHLDYILPMSNSKAGWASNDDVLVCHYTNGAALQNIIRQKELWASNTAFMNDTYERRLANR